MGDYYAKCEECPKALRREDMHVLIAFGERKYLCSKACADRFKAREFRTESPRG